MEEFRYDLKNTTFLIYVRIDSGDRLINIKLVVKHFAKYFKASIYLLEVGAFQKIPQNFINEFNIDFKFIKDSDKIFHATRYRNYLLSKCKTPYFFICDADVIVSPKAILKCVDYMEKSPGNILVYPYSGYFYNIPKKWVDQYAVTINYEFLTRNQDEYFLWFKYSVGGIFGGKIISFKENEIDNEAIYGWGPDDKERYYRLKMEGFKIIRSEMPLYHLSHERNLNSNPASKKIKIENQLEYLKIFNGNCYEG